MLFEDASAYFYCPTSTTSNAIVAHHFSTKDGVIISTDAMDNKCLDCLWMSDFEYEKEYLFMEGYPGNIGYEFMAKLRIVGLINCVNGFDDSYFFEAMNIFSNTIFIRKVFVLGRTNIIKINKI